MIEERVADRDELTESRRGCECGFDDLGLEDPSRFVDGGELEILFRAEMGVDATLAHVERPGEVADRESFEAVERRKRYGFTHDRFASVLAVSALFPLIHLDKIARSVVLCLRQHERACYLGGKAVTTYLQELPDGDVRLADEEATIAPTASVQRRAERIDSTGYFYGTALGWSKLGVFARVPRDQSRVSDRPEEDR